VKLNIIDVRTGKMGVSEVNDFRVGIWIIVEDDASSFGVITRRLLFLKKGWFLELQQHLKEM
jgi:hypothetical protein